LRAACAQWRCRSGALHAGFASHYQRRSKRPAPR
jgi:hypothetical protein